MSSKHVSWADTHDEVESATAAAAKANLDNPASASGDNMNLNAASPELSLGVSVAASVGPVTHVEVVSATVAVANENLDYAPASDNCDNMNLSGAFPELLQDVSVSTVSPKSKGRDNSLKLEKRIALAGSTDTVDGHLI